MSGILRSPIEVLAGELGAFAAKTEQSINQQLAAALMEMRAEMAAIRQGWAETKLLLMESEQARAAEQAERLATIKDGEPGRSVTMDDVAPMIMAEVSRVFATVPVPKDGLDGRNGVDVDPEVVRGIVSELVDAAVSAIPAPAAGKDADPVDVGAVVADVLAAMPPLVHGKDADPAVMRHMIEEAVAALPPAIPGKDADPEVIRAMVAAAVAEIPPAPAGKDADPELIASLVREEVAKIPPPQPGRDADPVDVALVVAEVLAAMPAPVPGKDADPEVIREMVAAAVADIPPAPAGKDADPALVAQMVREEVAKLPPAEPGKDGESVNREEVLAMVRDVVATIPVPKDGKDVDPELVAQMVDATVAKAVAALPSPERGEPGPAGKLGRVLAWEDRVHYQGDTVSHAGAVFQAVRDTGRAPPHDDWDCIIPAAERGADGKTPVFRGTWSRDDEYRSLDVVALNGGSFVALNDDPGECPGAGWQLLAGGGSRGKPGEAGRKGDPGPAGPGIVGTQVGDDGVVSIRQSDGSVVKIDLYPVLIKLRG